MSHKLLKKTDTANSAFICTGLRALSARSDLLVTASDWSVGIDKGRAVDVDRELVPGNDYVLIVNKSGIVRVADYAENDSDSVKVGGFHFALGGNAVGNKGGDSTPQINQYTIWDVNFRPKCDDPRGMFLVSNSPGAPHVPSFWRDIYFLNTDPDTHGTSRAGVQIADGYSNTPQGYDNLNYHTAQEILARFGKQLMSIEEFWASTYGVDEYTVADKKPSLTGLDAARTSYFGGMQDIGNLYCWGHDGHVDVPKAALFGGHWGDAAVSGSRASNWSNLPSNSSADISARGRSDHLNLDIPAR